MIKKFALTVLLVFLTTVSASAMDVGGKMLPDTLESGSQMLLLNGGGIRKKIVINLYSAGLYLNEKSENASAIVLADEPMAIRLHIISGLITPKKMEKSTRKGFKKSMHALVGMISPSIDYEIDMFVSLFKDGIEVDDVFDMVYIPGTGVQAFKNKELKATVKGLDFKRALFGIWLSDKPVQTKLKKGMLGLDS